MRKLFRFLRPYWKQIALVVLLLVIQAIANLYLPDLNAEIINKGIAKGDVDFILRTGGIMVGVTLVLGIVSVVAVYLGARTAMAFGRDLRSAVFRAVESFSAAELNRFGTASLITRNTNDVQQVQMLAVLGLNIMILAPVMAIGGIIMALRQDVPLSGLLLVVIPLMGLVVGLAMSKALPLFRKVQVKTDRINQVVREYLAGVRVIRAFVRTEHERRRFQEVNADLTQTTVRVQRLFATVMPAMMTIFNMTVVAILLFGAKRVDAGAMQVGNLTAFIAYMMQILISVMMAVIMFAMVPRAAASAERIVEVLETEPSIKDPENPAPESGECGFVAFEHVGFRYPGAEHSVLCDVSFAAAPGEVTAIVGSTGSGKSTLINLIPRFYDATEGRVLVDCVDVREMPREQLWTKIGFVPQKAFLFSGTVADNLRFGKPDATDEELWHALEVAQAREFVEAMPQGLETPVAQGGVSVSGGQRQRLAIARALVKRPDVYIFDDSFSALDFKTDAKLRRALRHETKGATVIIVAQRVSTIMDADRIVVLDQGRVVGIGVHKELLDSCETYREIVESQLTLEEIA
ncbi:ABC transporter ATP-binding protein/permease [Coriobacteriia bacterium Es71-Z0120]|uniref:ABC transporter ATP-binding protein n=1 Tax=Parvivirga hydrogeniphila TaxID=2939460 RepID=UPI002260D7B7|nr:ABC transporter ATP-binding protein [Parvivirga hydrogeniphila]MCL4078381.1 ABC transporter ATP-binding protein/permease [Parvivirga hydrogeniphila]